jgi:hypothetical protein
VIKCNGHDEFEKPKKLVRQILGSDMLRITTETSALGVFRKISKKWSTATFSHFLTMFSGLKSKNFAFWSIVRGGKTTFLHRQVEAEKLRKCTFLSRFFFNTRPRFFATA